MELERLQGFLQISWTTKSTTWFLLFL